MKAIIITRYLKESPDFLELRTFFSYCEEDILTIAVNQVDISAKHRIFNDWFHYPYYINKYYKERLYTVDTAKDKIPKHYHNLFVFFKPVYSLEESHKTESSVGSLTLYTHSTLISAIDLALKLKAKHILLIANNNVDNENFVKPLFEATINRMVDSFKSLVSLYQISNGNFNLPVMNITEFNNI